MTKKQAAQTPTKKEYRRRVNKAVRLAKDSQWHMAYPDDNHTMYFLNRIIQTLAPERYERIMRANTLWSTGERPDGQEK